MRDYFGAKEIGRLDEAGIGYEWNILSVLQHEDGRLFWYADSGCSCNDEYEDICKLEDFTLLVDGNLTEFEKAVKDFPCDGPDKIELLAKVTKILKTRDKERG